MTTSVLRFPSTTASTIDHLNRLRYHAGRAQAGTITTAFFNTILANCDRREQMLKRHRVSSFDLWMEQRAGGR